MTLYSGANGNFYKFINLQSAYLAQHNTDLVTIFDHNHTNNPIHGTTAIQAGTITAASIQDGTITSAKLAAASSELVIANDTYKKWRNAANNADLNVIKVNSSDQLEFEQDVAKIRFQYNTTVKGETSGGADHNLFKVNSSTQWELLNTMYSQTVAPKTDATYDLGTTALYYALAYVNNLRISTYSTSTNFYAQGSWTPVPVGLTSAGSASGGSAAGTYVRIGKFCFCSFYANWTGHTGTGTIGFTGLPFTSTNVNSSGSSMSVGTAIFNSMTFTGDPILFVDASATTLRVGVNATGSAFVGVAMDTNMGLTGTFMYEVA